jgi:hypothetical protein
MAEPLVLSTSNPGVGPTASIALNNDATRIYLGRRWSMQRRRPNLLVFSPDNNGVGQPREFVDSALPLPVGGRSTVSLIRHFPAYQKLYLATTVDYPHLRQPWPAPDGRVLTVYNLTPAGDPMGEPRSYDAGNRWGSLIALAKHPTLNLLYLVGWGEPHVVVYEADAQGEPQRILTKFRCGGYGKYEVTVSPDGKRLYLGTYPDALEVVSLNSQGMPEGSAKTFSAGRAPGANGADYLRFRYTPQALYRRSNFELTNSSQPPALWPLVVWPLDPTTGDPIGNTVPY